MTSSELETLAGMVCFLSLVGFCLWLTRRHDPDDEAAGVSLGQSDSPSLAPTGGEGRGEVAAAPAWSPATVLLRRCGWCRTQQGEEPVLLMPGTAFEITDGICPACRRAHFPKRTATPNPELRTTISDLRPPIPAPSPVTRHLSPAL